MYENWSLVFENRSELLKDMNFRSSNEQELTVLIIFNHKKVLSIFKRIYCVVEYVYHRYIKELQVTHTCMELSISLRIFSANQVEYSLCDDEISGK